MARKVDVFPEFIAANRYPWEEWLDGDVWELSLGQDIKSNPRTFRSSAITQAKQRGGKVRTRLVKTAPDDPGRLYVQFYRA